MTNADRIRNITDEELTRWIAYLKENDQAMRNRTIRSSIVRTILEWLKQELEGE